ncbi:hypothetical protein [Ornithinibacillus californiensis]|uniref:hypothetical protein n=1 Tax=Ornithinibacillus californiensis TaxID=161536 RepID=UPI00064DC436|nr:hypothetical protein [Ornithinibacillus californiensis]
MEQETILKEILHAVKLHGEHMNKQFVEMDAKFEKKFVEMDEKFEKKFAEMDANFEKRFDEMDEKFEKRFDEMDKRFDRLEKKVDGIRMDLTDTQQTTNYLLKKIADHDNKLLELSQQQR